MLRVGIDLVHVPDIRAAIDEHGDRYLQRVYTPAEVERCTGPDGAIHAHRLAARFAAKEAAMKVLRPETTDAIPWPAIEVVRADGAPALALHGPAAALAAQAGLTTFALSFSHEDAYATAVVVGT